jgi:hypothetical protein
VSISTETALVSRVADSFNKCTVTAALLGPSSRWRFSQNERSIFGFLNSVDPFGFREFLENTAVQRFSYYCPSQFWDYLRANFEPGILASSDGHRWALGLEVAKRVEAKGDAIHVQIVKTVALIEMFRDGSGRGQTVPLTEVTGFRYPSIIRLVLNGSKVPQTSIDAYRANHSSRMVSAMNAG